VTLSILATIAAGLFTVGVASAQTPSPSAAIPDRPGVVMSERISMTGNVESIDQDRRTVTVKRPSGETITLKAPPGARNFDQIATGDSIRVEYLDSVAIFVRKASDPPQATTLHAVTVAPKGQKPEGVLVETTEITARVEAIDYSARTVTLRGPQGNSRTINVDSQVKRLNEVKPGDEVVIRTTDAIAITVSK
jgi:hypothetical protein